MKLCLFILSAGFLAGCSSSDTTSDSSAKNAEVAHETSITLSVSQIAAIGIMTAKVEEREIGTLLRLPGHVEPVPEQEAYITALIAGRVEKINVYAGDRVKAGQTMLRITGSELGNYIANLRNTWVELDRQQRLSERGVGVTRKLRDARIAYAAARQHLRAIGYPAEQIDQIAKSEVDIEAMSLAAPIGGILLEQNAVLGGPVFPGDKLMHIVKLQPIWVEADVYEKDLNKLKPGLPAHIIPASAPEENYEGRILKIIPKIDFKQRSAKVIIQLPNRNEELNPGMFVSAEVMTSLEKTNAVPSEAVQIDGETSFVLIAENDSTFRRMEIKARPQGAKYVPVPEVRPGTRVVTAGAFQIMSAIKGVEAESD